jgi:hypothetical protein
MSSSLVPLTVYKGAGHEHIPFNAGNPHITADFHSIRTKTEAPAYVTSGFYKVEAGPTLSAHYAFEEAKYVLSGQIDVYVSFVVAVVALVHLLTEDSLGRSDWRHTPLGQRRLCFLPCWH